MSRISKDVPKYIVQCDDVGPNKFNQIFKYFTTYREANHFAKESNLSERSIFKMNFTHKKTIKEPNEF